MDRLSFSNQALYELLYWQDPVNTGIVFSIVNLVFFLLTVGDYSVITLVCYLLCFFLLVNAGFKAARLALNVKKDSFGYGSVGLYYLFISFFSFFRNSPSFSSFRHSFFSFFLFLSSFSFLLTSSSRHRIFLFIPSFHLIFSLPFVIFLPSHF
jgi:hypothetical protein